MKEQLAILTFNSKLKQIKKNIGKTCLLLVNVRRADGSRIVRTNLMVSGKKETFEFEVPYDLTTLNSADYNYLEEQILFKTHSNVTKGNKELV